MSALGFSPEPCPECQAPVIWAMDGTGRAVAIDEKPSPEGSFALVSNWDDSVQARAVASVAARFGRTLRTSHYVTCLKKKTLRARRR